MGLELRVWGLRALGFGVFRVLDLRFEDLGFGYIWRLRV